MMNMLNTKQSISLGLVIFLLVGCSAISRSTPSVEIVKTTFPTGTETAEKASAPTVTPSYTNPPEVRPSIIPTIYELPSWLTHSTANVLAALITDDFKGIRSVAFFNAETAERFEIPMPKETSGFFWYDNMNFGLLSKDLNTAFRISFETGKVFAESIPPQSTRLLDKDWVNGLIMFKESNSEFVFDRVILSNASKDKSFVAEWVDSQKNIVVTDTKTNQIVWQTATAEKVWTTSFLWSPVQDTHLAFLQGSFKPRTDVITENITLTIVDVTTGNIISTYAGDFGGLEWSPDGKMILYRDSLVHYSNYGIPFQGAPCILFLESGEKRCLRAIPRLVPNGYKLETTQNYEWGTDSDAIYYTYVYYSQSENKTLGNLCIYSLVDGHITCPTQNLDVMQGSSVGLYGISPNHEYIYFCYWDNNTGNSNDGIIKFGGDGLFSWTGAIQDGGPTVCSFDTLWRPLP